MLKKKILFLFIVCFIFWSVLQINKPILAAENTSVTNGMIYNIQNKASGKYLNVNLGTDANGTNVIQWTGDGSIEQKFRLVYVPVDYNSTNIDAYKLYAMCSSKGAGRVLDLLRKGGSASGPIESGCNVDIWANGSTVAENDCQYWKVQNEGSGYFSIRLKYNQSLVLTSYGTANGSGAGTSPTSAGNVFVSTAGSSLTNNQLWKFVEVTGSPAYPYKCNRGISNRTYFVSSSINTSAYTNFINPAATSWNPTITLTKVADSLTSDVDYYGADWKYNGNIKNDWVAVTIRYTGSPTKQVVPFLGNWSYSEVTINKDHFPASANKINDNQRLSTMAHELGHAFGLMEYKDKKDSIMYPDVTCTVTTPQSVDRTAIAYKY